MQLPEFNEASWDKIWMDKNKSCDCHMTADLSALSPDVGGVGGDWHVLHLPDQLQHLRDIQLAGQNGLESKWIHISLHVMALSLNIILIWKTFSMHIKAWGNEIQINQKVFSLMIFS